MFSFLRPKRGQQVGLDIHHDEIRMMLFTSEAPGVQVQQFTFESLPPGSIVEGKIKHFDAVLSVVKRLVQQLQVHGLPTLIAIPASGVFSKRIKLSAELSSRAKEVAIDEQLGRHFPALGPDLAYDFTVLQMVPPDQEDVLVVAIPTEQLNAYVMVASLAGLKVKVVDVDFYAQKRAQEQQGQQAVRLQPQLNSDVFLQQADRFMVCQGLAWWVASNINLLPWRDYQRAVRAKRWKIVGVLAVSVSAVVGLIRIYPLQYAEPIQTITLAPPPDRQIERPHPFDLLQKTKFVGYLKQGERVWGLVKLPNNQVRTVQLGSEVGVMDAVVKSISQDQLVLVLKDHKERILHAN